MNFHASFRLSWAPLLLILTIFVAAVSAQDSSSIDEEQFHVAQGNFQTGKTLALVGAAAPVMVFVSSNEWVAFSLFLGWQTMGEIGLGMMNSNLQDLHSLALKKQGPDLDGWGYSPSRGYLIGNIFGATGIGLITIGVIRGSKDKANLAGWGILSFLIGDVVHGYSLYRMSEDGEYYQNQYRMPVEKKSTDEISWNVQPTVYLSSTGVAPGFALLATF